MACLDGEGEGADVEDLRFRDVTAVGGDFFLADSDFDFDFLDGDCGLEEDEEEDDDGDFLLGDVFLLEDDLYVGLFKKSFKDFDDDDEEEDEDEDDDDDDDDDDGDDELSSSSHPNFQLW